MVLTEGPTQRAALARTLFFSPTLHPEVCSTDGNRAAVTSPFEADGSMRAWLDLLTSLFSYLPGAAQEERYTPILAESLRLLCCVPQNTCSFSGQCSDWVT